MSGFVYLVYEAGNFRLGLDLAVDLRRRGLGDTVFFSPYYLPDTAAYVEEAAKNGLAYVHESTAQGGDADAFAQLRERRGPPAGEVPPFVPDPPARLLHRARVAFARRGLGRLHAESSRWEAHYRKRIEVASRFLAAAGAASLVLPEDNVERDSACWSRAVRARGGRSTVISYGAMNPLEAAIAYHESPAHAVADAASRRFARLFPRWRTVHRGREMLRLPVARALAMESLGLAPRDPWLVNTGDVDAIAVESEHMRAQFVAHGLPGERIHAIGHTGLDALAANAGRRDAIREQWHREHGCAPSHPVVLCAMPPDQYPRLPAKGYGGFAELVDAWMEEVAALRPAFFPFASPHPTIAPEFRARMRSAGVPVLEGGVANWLPACDLYVASVSSTIKWALACGKPVVNYDCYDYRHTDYEGIDEVVAVATREEFRAALRRFAEPRYFRDKAEAAWARRERYGILDGRSGDRIARLVTA